MTILRRIRNKINFYEYDLGFIRYFKNTSWLLAEKIFKALTEISVGVWIIRYLGPEDFGMLSYAQSFAAIFLVLSTLGLDEVVIREIVKDKNRVDELIGTAFVLKLVGAIVIFVFLATSISLTLNDTYLNIMIFIIASATIFQAFDVVDFYFKAKVLSKYVVVANSISLSISSIVKIVLILNEAPLIAFVWTSVFDGFVVSITLVYIYIKNTSFSIRRLLFNKLTAIDLLRNSWPLILSGLIVTIYMKIDQIMIKEMLSIEAVGQYAAASRMSEAWYSIAVIISISLFPAIISAKLNDNKLYSLRIQMLYGFMVWVPLVAAIITTFIGESLVGILFGAPYSQAAGVLIIQTWSGIFVFMGVASGKWFLTENLQIIWFWRVFYGMFINILLNIFLIPRYGIQGAAFSTLATLSVTAYFSDFFNKKTRPIFYTKTKALLLIRGLGSK